MKTILVVGAGPAGCMAAIEAAQGGAQVYLLEKNNCIGRKLAITGKGRCNVTNIAERAEFLKHVPGNSKFLYSAFNQCFNQDIMQFFEQLGVPLKVERGGRVFPVSDSAKDITSALQRKMLDLGVILKLNTSVKKIVLHEGKLVGVQLADDSILKGDAVIMATGGASYPATGSNGEGMKLVVNCGHTLMPLTPSLVPLESDDGYIGELQGLSLRNVRLTAFIDGKKEQSLFGEMMFTHFGITGPIVLSMSRMVCLALSAGKEVVLALNLKPALTKEQLDARLQRDLQKYSKKNLGNTLVDLLPHRLIPVVLDLSYLEMTTRACELDKKSRLRLLDTLQHLEISISRPRPLSEAIVTSGGISIKEIDPKSMESKIVAGLYCVGEMLDVDGYTGGYNLQIAFSTGYAAGRAAAKEVE